MGYISQNDETDSASRQLSGRRQRPASTDEYGVVTIHNACFSEMGASTILYTIKGLPVWLFIPAPFDTRRHGAWVSVCLPDAAL